MRFWFANEETQTLADSSEIGPQYHVRLPSWQLDRAVVDEEVLRRAVDAGAELRRPAQDHARASQPKAESNPWKLKPGDATETIRCRWVIDASGVAARARPAGRLAASRIPSIPTAAAWARWRGVKDWDGRELAGKISRVGGALPRLAKHRHEPHRRRWLVELVDSAQRRRRQRGRGLRSEAGDVSRRETAKLGDRLREFLVAASRRAGTARGRGMDRGRRALAEKSGVCQPEVCGRRLCAGRRCRRLPRSALQPRHGLDCIHRHRDRRAHRGATAEANRWRRCIDAAQRHFSRSYRRWFEAIYKDKYEYLGEYDLMRLAFRMDLGLYYLGIVSQPFKYGAKALAMPPFAVKVSTPVYWLMRTLQPPVRRDRARAPARGAPGPREFRAAASFSELLHQPGRFAARSPAPRCAWLLLELREGWRRWFGDPPARSRSRREAAR